MSEGTVDGAIHDDELGTLILVVNTHQAATGGGAPLAATSLISTGGGEVSSRIGVTPCVTVFLITFIKVLIKNQIYRLIQFQVAKVKIKIKFSKQVNKLTNLKFQTSFHE
jgi:hypothetical protein